MSRAKRKPVTSGTTKLDDGTEAVVVTSSQFNAACDFFEEQGFGPAHVLMIVCQSASLAGRTEDELLQLFLYVLTGMQTNDKPCGDPLCPDCKAKLDKGGVN